MTGFNRPPGCNVNDIPGNRPEDVEQDVLMTEFHKSLTKEEVNLITDICYTLTSKTSVEFENIIWKAIEFGRRVGNQQDQPEDYPEVSKRPYEPKLYEAPTCCCCAGYDSKGKLVRVPEPRVLFKCERPGCNCYTCGEHRQVCGYCLGCCVEVHEDFNHSIRPEGEVNVS